MTDRPDYLRSPENIFTPDPRSTGFEILTEQGSRAKTLQDQHAALIEITLHEGVPRDVVVKFETAKNLNLFSWFVYRFHSAAKSHVYECLELALRMRFKDALYLHEEQQRRTKHEQAAQSNPRKVKPHTPLDKASFRPTLRPLLTYAIEIGALKNEHFSVWQLKTRLRARSRRDAELLKKMIDENLTELQFDDSDLAITDQDRDHDYLGDVLNGLTALRNHYAHGTTALDHQSLSALRLASEVINQIFSKPSTAACDGL